MSSPIPTETSLKIIRESNEMVELDFLANICVCMCMCDRLYGKTIFRIRSQKMMSTELQIVHFLPDQHILFPKCRTKKKQKLQHHRKIFILQMQRKKSKTKI